MSTSADAAPNTIRQIRLLVPMSDVDLASDRLWQAGAQAVEEMHLPGEHGLLELRTVLSQDDDVSRHRIGEIPSSWTLTIADCDVRPAHTWREFATPIEVGNSLVVVPAWQQPAHADEPASSVNGDRLVVQIEPGGAFGLGDHPTTRLMLQILEGLPTEGAEVLDVGCGTGVLGIVAAKRGAARVVGVDVASAACEATADNAARNRVDVEVSTTPIDSVTGSFDIVLANILAPALISMSADLRRLTAPGGALVVSGLIEGHADHVLAALRPFDVVDQAAFDGWSAYVLSAPTTISPISGNPSSGNPTPR